MSEKSTNYYWRGRNNSAAKYFAFMILHPDITIADAEGPEIEGHAIAILLTYGD